MIILMTVLLSQSAIVPSNTGSNYNYIIVGAGYAGLGACRTLTAAGVPVAQILVIEAKNRTGGRCTNFTYGGVQQDLGAAFIQNPRSNNSLDVLAKGIPSFPANRAWFGNESEWYVNKSLVTADDLTAAKNLYAQFVIAVNATYNNDNDISLATVLSKFQAQNAQKPQYLRDRVNMVLQLWAN